jgi:peroxiredoxin
MLKKTVFSCLLLFAGFFRLEAQFDSLHVYLFLSETCPICKSATTELNDLYEQMKGKPVKFAGYFPSVLSTAQSRQKFAAKYKIRYALNTDSLLNYTRQFNATVTPEVVVFKPADGSVLYRGLINNAYLSVGKRRQITTEHYLKDALEQYFENKINAVTFTQPVGCIIQNFK